MPQTGCSSVQPVATSTAVRVVRKNPSVRSPQWRPRQLTVPLQSAQQIGDDRGQELAAHPVPPLPELGQRFGHFRPVAPWPPREAGSGLPRACPERSEGALQQPDGCLTVQPSRLTELVQDLPLLSLFGGPVPGAQGRRVFVYRQSSHVASLPSGNPIFEATQLVR